MVGGCSGLFVEGGFWLPLGWDRLWLSGVLPDRLVCHARLREGEGEARKADLGLYTAGGESLGGVEGFTLKRASRAALLGLRVDELLYGVEWREAAVGLRDAESLADPAEEESAPGMFVLAGGGELAGELGEELDAAGADGGA